MRFMNAALIVLCAATCVICVGRSTAQPTSQNGAGASTVNEQNFAHIKEHQGTWSEEDVIGLMGQPVRYSMLKDGTLEMVWEDINRVRVEFVKGKAEFFWAQFSSKLPLNAASLSKFRKLRQGMSEKDVVAVFGEGFDRFQGPCYVHGNLDPIEDLTVREGATLYVWQSLRRLSAQFTDGKVTGYGWVHYKD